MKCIICGSVFTAKRKTAKYCSDKCRVVASRVSVTDDDSVTEVSVTKAPKVSVTEVSVTDEVSVTEGTNMQHGVKSMTDKNGYKICNTCFKRIIDIKEQWVDLSKVTPEDAATIDKCITCVKNG
jgi:hypothetical protein